MDLRQQASVHGALRAYAGRRTALKLQGPRNLEEPTLQPSSANPPVRERSRPCDGGQPMSKPRPTPESLSRSPIRDTADPPPKSSCPGHGLLWQSETRPTPSEATSCAFRSRSARRSACCAQACIVMQGILVPCGLRKRANLRIVEAMDAREAVSRLNRGPHRGHELKQGWPIQ